jgi:hypothetical protein
MEKASLNIRVGLSNVFNRSNLARRDTAIAPLCGYSSGAAFLQITTGNVSNTFKKKKQYETNRKQHDAKSIF